MTQRAGIVLAAILTATVDAAGQAAGPALPAFAGPPVPVEPAVIARDTEGHATIRATRVPSLRLDGTLDEPAYGTVLPISEFIQTEPVEGAPATQRTEVWLFFDDDNVYVAAKCWEPYPDRIVANELRRDAVNMFNNNDAFSFIFDTFYDRRNGIAFTANAAGGRTDGQSTNERQFNIDFNPIWDVRTGTFEGGWTVEAAVPFKSLRYRPGRAQIWGFNVRRHTPWKNETSFLMRTPASRGQMGIAQTSIAATVVGLEAPSGSRNLEIKPFVTASVASDTLATPRIANDASGDAGVDVKYGVTQNLTADFTYNTDFAQVEVDEQQINLTRFSLFFPEKREFFLENRGTFDFGGSGGTGGGGGSNSDTPTLFYSRRIGLHQGLAVPIVAGGRLTGRVGTYSLGLLNIQTEDEPSVGAVGTNFSVARIKRDVFRRSSVGALATRRSIRERGTGSNEAFGVDGNFAFFENLVFNTYWAKTRTKQLPGNDVSYRAQLDYAADRYGVQFEHLAIGTNFNPEIGFLRRNDMRKSFASARFSPRPRGSRRVRKYSWIGSLTYIENSRGRLETRDLDGEFGIEFHNSDKITLSYNDVYEFLPQPFRIAPSVTLPIGGYDFGTGRASWAFAPHRRLAGTISLEHGGFYNGTRTAAGVTAGRVEITPRFSLQPNVTVNWVDLPEGSFDTALTGLRVTYTMTPLMFTSALIQYNTSTNSVASNIRLRWEYAPGSELFVVYNEQRNSLARSFPDLVNRAFIVKVNRLVRF